MEQLVRELNLKDSVRFLGKLDAVEEILSVSDLFLLPSETESFGLAALEAMACKLPVISSNAGGIPELNVDGVTGFLNEVGDIDGMAANAIHILENQERLDAFKTRALAHAKTFDIALIMPQYEAFYQEIISNSKK